ncbi:MAG TPA: hypothetical protein VGH51_23005 [Candidatus Angelobacter sp.]
MIFLICVHLRKSAAKGFLLRVSVPPRCRSHLVILSRSKRRKELRACRRIPALLPSNRCVREFFPDTRFWFFNFGNSGDPGNFSLIRDFTHRRMTEIDDEIASVRALENSPALTESGRLFLQKLFVS